jgi:hypothetical protein
MRVHLNLSAKITELMVEELTADLINFV